MKFDVFISYSRRDYIDENGQIIPGNIVSQIKELLDTNGITYWFDEDGIFSGDAFASEIARNIKRSKIFLFISSEHSNASVWTSREIATANTHGKKIIPFKYDNSLYNDSVIMYISCLDYIDYQAYPNKALKRLLSSIKESLNRLDEEEQQKILDEERRRNEEILRKERAAQLQSLQNHIATLESNKAEIEKEIAEQEKSISELYNNRRIIERRIAETRRQITELNHQTKAPQIKHPHIKINDRGRESINIPIEEDTKDTTPGFFAREWAELREALREKSLFANIVQLSLFAAVLLFAVVQICDILLDVYACATHHLHYSEILNVAKKSILAFISIALVFTFYRLIKNYKYSILNIALCMSLFGGLSPLYHSKYVLIIVASAAVAGISVWTIPELKRSGKPLLKDWSQLAIIASLVVAIVCATLYLMIY